MPTSEAVTGPVTIGDLKRSGEALEAGCTRYWNVVYIDPHKLSFHGLMAVPNAHQRMKCSKCGERAGYRRPCARIGGVYGQYPGTGKNQ